MPTATFTAVDARRGSSTLLSWVEFQSEPTGGGTPVRYRWSHVSIPDVNAPNIRGRVIQWGSIVRALSDRTGRGEGSRFTWTHVDVDRQMLALMDDVNQRYLQNRIVVVQLITDVDRRNGFTPLTIFRGVVRKVLPNKRRQLAWEAEDYLSTEFSTSNDEEQLPRRRISKAFFADAPDAVVGLPEPIIYGQVEEPGPDFHGAVPCIPVGTAVISSFTWTRFLICGHAIKEFRAAFSGGVTWDVGQIGVDYLAPGWSGQPLYEDITVGSETRRYAFLYARGPIADNAVSGTAPLTCNVFGTETAGNGSGTLITDIIDQYAHFYDNYAIQNYLSGAYLSTPQFHPVLDPTLRRNTASFTTAKAALAARLGGGYPGGGVIGSNGDLRTKGDWLQAFDQSADTKRGFNLAGQFIVVVPDAGTPVATYTQMDDIISDSFNGAPLDWDGMFNVLPYSFNRNYASNAWFTENAQIVVGSSITGYKATKPDALVELWFVRSATVSESNMAGRAARSQHPPRRPVFDTGIYGLAQTDIGQTINVTHADGPGGSGWVNRKVLVDRITAQPGNQARVTIEGEDLDGRGTLSYTTVAGYPGSSAGGGLNFNVGTSPTVTVAVATSGPRSLGGDRNRLFRANSAEPIPNYRVVEIDWSTIPAFNVRAYIESMTTNASNPVDIELVRVDSSDAYVSTAVSFTAHSNVPSPGGPWTKESQVLPTGTGVERYLLRAWCTNSSAINVNALGELRLEPI